jgi:hypothetical protein
MAYPVVNGSTSYSGTFIPEIWSSKLIEKFYDATVLGAISNTTYEGEISNQGDKVLIRTIPSLSINDYSSGQTLVNQRPESSNVELLIDKGKYWSAIIDDVQEKQADINQMNLWAQDAAEQMKIAIDTDILGSIYPDIAAANKGATAGRITAGIDMGAATDGVPINSATVLDFILDMGQVLDEQNRPETGRFLVLPYWMTTKLKKSDIKDASLTGDGTTPMRNGRVGIIDRFTIYNSNNLPFVSDTSDTITTNHYYVFAGVTQGLTFASQLTKTETLRAESTFGDIMRGLQVYGYKVVDGESLVGGYVYQAAE